MAADILSLPCETNHDTECLHAALAAWNIENGVQVADLWELPLDARCEIMRRAQALKIFRVKGIYESRTTSNCENISVSVGIKFEDKQTGPTATAVFNTGKRRCGF